MVSLGSSDAVGCGFLSVSTACRVAAGALPHLLAKPAVLVSTGRLEKLFDEQVNQLLAMRHAGFGNIERTNNLFDLVVARAHEAFDDLSAVAALLRGDAGPYGG